jgi:ribose/xylose/arabinose/galactoside ABC-type transport system permease subunit
MGMLASLRGRGLLRELSPYLILGVMVLVLALVPTLTTHEVTYANLYNVFQNFAALGLVALALGITMIAGEFDLSVAAMYSLGGMIAVLTGVQHPVLGVLAALGVAAIAGLVQGGLIAALRMNSMPITLGGYLVIVGVTYLVAHDKSVAYENYGVGLWLDDQKLRIFSPRSLISLAVFAIVAVGMRYTRVGRDVKAVGGGRRSSRIAGVPVDRLLIGVFVFSAVTAALPGALLTYSLASAAPNIGLDQLAFSATAALIGGIGLAGGRGSPVGILAGVLSLSILQELLVITAQPEYIRTLITGLLLLTVTVVWAPDLGHWLKTFGVGRAAHGEERPAAPLP